MKLIKKLGVITLSTGLTMGILTPAAGATSLGNIQQNDVQIQVSQVDSVVTKSDLIKRFKEFFPNQFDFLDDSDFHMWTGRSYPDEEDTIRYDLSFDKQVNGNFIYGGASFVGDDLEIVNFHYRPDNAVDALFPAKVSKEEAKQAALSFLSKFPESSKYQLQPDSFNYYPSQLLTEPFRYSFTFVHMKDNVPISDQQIQVTVLGNGEVSEFYRYSNSTGTKTYDDVTKILPEQDMITKIKENLSIDLQYSIDVDYETGASGVKLVYEPNSSVYGIHALTGDWYKLYEFSSQVPKKNEIQPIVTQTLPPKNPNMTIEEAKALAEELLAIDSKDIKLRIESIDEVNDYNGQDVININYMYEYKNGGTGTNLVLDKRTGEIIQYTDIRNHLSRDLGIDEIEKEKEENVILISEEEALSQAVEYLKEYAPSYLDNYSMPIVENIYNEDRGTYSFAFPRIVNGLIVSGNYISLSVSAEDGSLLDFNVSFTDIKNWPSVDKVISKEKAAEKYFENFKLDLNYTNLWSSKNKDHYYLVYTPLFNDSRYNSLDANTGEWIDSVTNTPEVITPDWAEKELNYMIESGIINAGDAKTFDGNAKVTKGSAIEVIIKSMSHTYFGYPYGERNKSHSFENIKPDHRLYQVVERAVANGILKKDNNTFNLDESLTREELAVWYIRTLGLEEAAKSQGIYQLNFNDAKDVSEENVGYVALANSLGLLTTYNNKFNPKQEVSYADLTVSTVRLAHEVYKKGIQIRY